MMRFCEAMLATLFSFAILCLTLFSPASAQGFEETIVLKPQKISFVPKEYFFKEFIDSRKDKGSVGTIIIAGGEPGQKQISSSISLKGGTVNAIENLIKNSLTADPGLRAVIFNLKDLKISEEITTGGMIKGRVQIVISFEILRNNQPIKLIEYKGGSGYIRSANNLTVTGPVLVKNILNGLQYFNTWINREAATNEKLAEKVIVSFSEFKVGSNIDTLFYSISRLLAWKDFKSKPDVSSRFAAEIFTFFSFEEKSEIENSVLNVGLRLKIYVVKGFSWVKDFARNSHTLNHEQRHFDMVKIAAERFKKKISSESLTVDNYQGILSVEYLESLREMNRLQEQYDDETKHGTNLAVQNKWDRKIEEELRSYNVSLNLNEFKKKIAVDGLQ